MNRQENSGDDDVSWCKVSWRKSTRSANAGHLCVEVGTFHDGSDRIAVRDSKLPQNRLVVSREIWIDFIADVKNGDFDHRPD